MSIDRVATNSSSQYMLQQIMRANNNLDKSQAQVASGKASTDYAGIGAKTAALEAARAAADRAKSFQTNTNLAVTQTDLQDSQLTTLSSLAAQLQKSLQTAIGNADGTNLMETAQSVFEQAKSILNSKDANGNYMYSGEKTDTAPFTASDIGALNTAPIDSFFVNGDKVKSVLVGDGQTQPIGVLAKSVGLDLMNALNIVYQSGTPSGQLTNDQVNYLKSTALPAVTTANETVNAATAANGDAYNSVKDAMTNQAAVSNLYDGFVSDIEDVDMSEAVTRLNANQVALQAALSVTSRLGQLSLLNYLPNS